MFFGSIKHCHSAGTVAMESKRLDTGIAGQLESLAVALESERVEGVRNQQRVEALRGVLRGVAAELREAVVQR